MTRGGGGVLANDDVIIETPNFSKFFKEFFQKFPKINKIRTKIFNSSIFKDDCDILFTAARRFFLKCGSVHRQVLINRIQRPIFFVESLAVQLPASGLLLGIVD